MDLTVRVLAREPHFNVVGLRGGETQVACRQRDDAVVQIQFLQNVFSVASELLELLPRVVGQGELHQLDFLELMLPDQAARVLAVGAGLAAKAGV